MIGRRAVDCVIAPAEASQRGYFGGSAATMRTAPARHFPGGSTPPEDGGRGAASVEAI